LSKLFNTLEKIKNNEKAATAPVIADQSENIQHKKKRWPVYVVFTGLIAAMLVVGSRYFSLDQSSPAKNKLYAVNQTYDVDKRDQFAKTKVVPVPDSANLPPAITYEQPAFDKISQMISLNNQGTRLVQQGDHWQGIYYFDLARKMQPDRIEPLINMAVALSELRLNAPADRFFKLAMSIDASHPQLKRNLEIRSQSSGLL
jgi:hypothetical protein